MYINFKISGKFYDLSYPGKISKSIELDPLPYNVTVPADNFAKWYDILFTLGNQLTSTIRVSIEPVMLIYTKVLSYILYCVLYLFN